MAFWARQCLDMFSPGNQLATNPVVLKQTLAEGGANLLRGAQHLAEDLVALAAGTRRAFPKDSRWARTSPSRPARSSCATG